MEFFQDSQNPSRLGQANCGIRPSYYPAKTTKAEETLLYVREQRNKSSSVHRGDSKPSLLDELKENIEDAEDIRYNVRKYV